MIALGSPVLSAGEDKPASKSDSTSEAGVVYGDIEPRGLNPVIEGMRKRIADYAIVSERIKAKERAERENEKRRQARLAEQQEIKKYRPREPDVFPEDIIKSLQDLGVPRESILVEGNDLHDYLIKFVCEENVDITQAVANTNLTKEAIKQKINITCS